MPIWLYPSWGIFRVPTRIRLERAIPPLRSCTVVHIPSALAYKSSAQSIRSCIGPSHTSYPSGVLAGLSSIYLYTGMYMDGYKWRRKAPLNSLPEIQVLGLSYPSTYQSQEPIQAGAGRFLVFRRCSMDLPRHAANEVDRR